MIDHRSYTQLKSICEIKAWKNSGLNGIWTHDLCDTGAVLYQLSYQANRQYSYSPTALGREPSEHECEANAGTFARK